MQFGDIRTDDVLRLLPGKHEQEDPECAAYSEHGRKVSDYRAKSVTEEMHKVGVKQVENPESVNHKIVVQGITLRFS
jgi:hypothetical protein